MASHPEVVRRYRPLAAVPIHKAPVWSSNIAVAETPSGSCPSFSSPVPSLYFHTLKPEQIQIPPDLAAVARTEPLAGRFVKLWNFPSRNTLTRPSFTSH